MSVFVRSRRRLFAALFGMAVLAGFGARADAGSSPVALGEVKVLRSDPKLEQAFRGLVERELGEVDLSNVKAQDRFVLSASLTQMATRESSGQAETVAVAKKMVKEVVKSQAERFVADAPLANLACILVEPGGRAAKMFTSPQRQFQRVTARARSSLPGNTSHT